MLRLMSVLLVIALLIPVMSCSISRSAGFEDISVEECYTLIQENQENPDFIILDVRTPSEYASGYIENAVNLDYYEDGFEETLDTYDKNKTYLIYCRTANRTASVMNIMQRLEFTGVYNMRGGINAWTSAGYPVVT
jgi:rhodanese-related sulfurtransferase